MICGGAVPVFMFFFFLLVTFVGGVMVGQHFEQRWWEKRLGFVMSNIGRNVARLKVRRP